jgi:hypothetical protein
MKANGHNIQLAYNHLRLAADGSAEAMERFQRLAEVYARAIATPVYWATGQEYGILKDASAWAVCYRDSMNNR